MYDAILSVYDAILSVYDAIKEGEKESHICTLMQFFEELQEWVAKALKSYTIASSKMANFRVTWQVP